MDRLDKEEEQLAADYPDLADIPNASAWLRLAEVERCAGFSRAYEVFDQEQRRYRLRLAERTEYDRIKKEFEFLQHLREKEVPVAEPIGYGICSQGRRLFLQTAWLEGKTIAERLPDLLPYRQYALGVRAGRILKQIHFCSPPQRPCLRLDDFAARCRQAVKVCQCSKHSVPGMKRLSQMVGYGPEWVSACGSEQPASLLHGDFGPEKLYLCSEGNVCLADLADWKLGDPFADLGSILTKIRAASIPFAVGMLDCYFLFRPGANAWKGMISHAALVLLERVIAASTTGKPELGSHGLAQAKQMVETFCRDFQGDNPLIPVWYKRIRRAET